MFYAEVSRDEDGRLKGIEVQRLKDKLGTRQMPTAELLLDGLPAHRVSYVFSVIKYLLPHFVSKILLRLLNHRPQFEHSVS